MTNLEKIIKQTKQLEEELLFLQKMQSVDEHDIMLKSAIDAEKLFLNVRDYLESNPNYSIRLATEFQLQEADVLGIHIYEKGNSFFIEMPLLLPFKKLKKG